VKIKLTPELAYLIGFWKKRKTQEGLGVYGNEKQLELFVKEMLSQKIAVPEKIMTREDSLMSHNTAYKKFFEEVEGEELERFKYLNEYAASYLAGIFDSVGDIDEKGIVRITKFRSSDEMLFLRLGFNPKKSKEGAVIGKPRAFLAFIKNYVKLSADHPAFKLVRG